VLYVFCHELVDAYWFLTAVYFQSQVLVEFAVASILFSSQFYVVPLFTIHFVPHLALL
jgi:hypothetical protein